MYEIVKRKLSELIHANYNPRKDLGEDDPEYHKIKRSIEEFGYVDLIIINADNTIVGGHQRATVLEGLGYDEIEVVQVSLDKEKEKLLNIALNKITGEWDIPALKDLLQDLDTGEFDVTLTGFDVNELEYLMTENADVDIDSFFQDKPTDKQKEPEQVRCPHCGEWFDK